MAIHFQCGEVAAEAPPVAGQLLADAAEAAGLPLNTRCGGRGACGGCKLRVGPGAYVVNDERVVVPPGETLTVLGCQTRAISADVQVTVPSGSRVEQTAKIDDDFSLPAVRLDAQVKKFFLRVPPATLEEGHSDRRRMQHELRQVIDRLDHFIPLDVLRRLPAALRADGGAVTVTLGRINRQWCIIDVEPGDTTDINLAVAVDIGTTTVVAMLVDLSAGEILGRASLYNQQIRKADDVASRISYAEGPGRLRELHDLVVRETLNVLLRDLCEKHGCAGENIYRMTVSGNTVMSHLFLGLSPHSIGRIPFEPVANAHNEYLARDIGLEINPQAIVDVVPSIAGYIGGDITSDIHVAHLVERSELALLVDIGTNGEMVLSEGDRMVACATAAGPAFEGAGISHGIRAARGAIEHVRFGPDLEPQLRVIGNTAPVGLCGSAIIDFLAEAFRAGILNAMGRFDVERIRDVGRFLEVPSGQGRSRAFLLVGAEESGKDGEPIYVTEEDVAQVLKAKAATYAGMKTLLDVEGKRFSELQRFVLAGGFAKYIDLRNAITIGLLPEIPLERFDVIGNGSLAGAYLALVDPDALEAFQVLMYKPRVVELNLEAAFEGYFVDALALPNLDEEDFPSVMKDVTAG